jgi:[citrate (pro-3S)-lyase] ligase
MNANPMTCGHSYLIKKALEEVDYLYVFLLTEEETEIPLDIRRKILQEEVNKYNNVQMLECGRVWGSRVTFPEYFEKEENNDIIINAEKEILIFAKYIAKVLDIKKRFVGSEPNDKITNQFNIQLKQMLSKYGVELIEIPRLSIEGNYIQAGNVRRYIRERNFDALEKIVTPEALKILKKEYS